MSTRNPAQGIGEGAAGAAINYVGAALPGDGGATFFEIARICVQCLRVLAQLVADLTDKAAAARMRVN